ncbi:hypothetical protein JYT87_03175 [Nitrospira defluvii]|nr:hypothetical protein [Nitrospira defluvii]
MRKGKIKSQRYDLNSTYRWREWESGDEVKKYVESLTEKDEGLIDFLVGFLSISMSHGMSDRVIRKNYGVRHKSILDFITTPKLDEWIKRSRKIIANNDKLQERQKKALEVFVDEKDNPDNYRN